MLYQRIRLIFIAFLMVVTGVWLVVAAPIKKVPKQIKQLPQIELPYAVCNKGCVNLKVTQSCISNYEEVEVCTREDMRLTTEYKCKKYGDRCFPNKCAPDGKVCANKCYSDADCQQPARCHYGNVCKIPVWTCRPSVQGVRPDLLTNGFETVNCWPYTCKSMHTPIPMCGESCDNTTECASGFGCSSQGRCVP